MPGRGIAGHARLKGAGNKSPPEFTPCPCGLPRGERGVATVEGGGRLRGEEGVAMEGREDPRGTGVARGGG